MICSGETCSNLRLAHATDLKRRATAMRLLLLLAIFLVGGVFAADAPTTTTLYKSVGPDGRIVYSDRPPGEGQTAAKTLTFESLPASPLSAATLAYIEQLGKTKTPELPAASPVSEAVLFTTAWCGYCRKARAPCEQRHCLSRRGHRNEERLGGLRAGWRQERRAPARSEGAPSLRLHRGRLRRRARCGQVAMRAVSPDPFHRGEACVGPPSHALQGGL